MLQYYGADVVFGRDRTCIIVRCLLSLWKILLTVAHHVSLIHDGNSRISKERNYSNQSDASSCIRKILAEICVRMLGLAYGSPSADDYAHVPIWKK